MNLDQEFNHHDLTESIQKFYAGREEPDLEMMSEEQITTHLDKLESTHDLNNPREE